MSEIIEIEFCYTLDGTSKQIHLCAQAEASSKVSFIIRNIKTSSGHQVLPDQRIKKIKGLWVHTDSEKETYLSQAIGNGIELKLQESATFNNI